MIGELAVFYLFFGGAGAGAIAVCSLMDLLFVRRSFGPSGWAKGSSAPPEVRTVDYGFVSGAVLLATGVLCLIADLGRVDRLLTLFLHPMLSVMSFGAYALLLLLIVGGFLVLTSLLYLPEISRRIVSVAEILAIVFAIAVMAYTGLLLATTGGVALWWSPFVPALFLLSSLSAGIAVVFCVGAFVEDSARLAEMTKHLVRADAIIISLEILFAVGFILESIHDSNPGTAAGLEILLKGEAAFAWWIGFGIVGLAVSLFSELFFAGRGVVPRRALAVAAVLVLLGAFCLRWSVVDAGVLRDAVLEEPGLVYSFWN